MAHPDDTCAEPAQWVNPLVPPGLSRDEVDAYLVWMLSENILAELRRCADAGEGRGMDGGYRRRAAHGPHGGQGDPP